MDYKKGAADLTGYNLFCDQLDRLTRLEFTNASYSGETADFKYDATDQLTTADGANTANDESFVHDLSGNRRATGALNSVVDTNNRLTNDGTYTYQYDKDGNRTKRTKMSDGSYTDYVYDQRHRLTSAVTKSLGGTVTQSVDYTYDEFDRLVKRVIDFDGAGIGAATMEYFAYDGHDVALKFDASGALTKRYLNGPAADQVLAEEQIATAIASSDRTYWAISDNAGTVRDVYNSAGTLKNHLTYDAFGNIKAETAPSVDFLYAFQGLLRDEATGFYLSQTRWLDPLTGKWLQEDWIGFAGGDVNLSRFVGNSPTNYADPSGMRHLPLTQEQLLEAALKTAAADSALALTFARGGASYGLIAATIAQDQIVRKWLLESSAAHLADLVNKGIITEQEAIKILQSQPKRFDQSWAHPDVHEKKWQTWIVESVYDSIVRRAVDVATNNQCNGVPDFETKQMTKEEWIAWQKTECGKAGQTNCKEHHVLTNKHPAKYTPLLNAELASIGMTLNDPANICLVWDNGDGQQHRSKHPPEYHERMLALVRKITSDTTLNLVEKRRAVRALLWEICMLLQKDSYLRKLVTTPVGK